MTSGISHFTEYTKRHRLDVACHAAQVIVDQLTRLPSVIRCEIAGSVRRSRETIGDLDIVASSEKPADVISRFVHLPIIDTVLSQGDTRSSVRLRPPFPIQADLRVVSDDEYPFALHYFTGSKAHATAMRGRAKDMGFKLNEYGLFKGKKRISCKTERDIFKTLKLAHIPPELRENFGEMDAAETGRLPRLVEEKDIRGIFHVHSNWSDGVAELEDILQTAQNLGLAYIGLSDHSQSAHYANGLDLTRVKQQEKVVHKLRKKFKIRIFWGIESDILLDGSLDYPSSILDRFDFVIASIHSAFTLPEAKMTKRIIAALKNPYTTMLGHPTGRLLLQREAYAVNVNALIDAAADYGKVIELNAHPARLDIDWHWGPTLREKKVRISINPDAHTLRGLSDFKYGVGIARKAWLTKTDVINTYTAKQVEKFL